MSMWTVPIKVTTTGGEYCAFCYGTNHTKKAVVLERHDMEKKSFLSLPMADLPS